MNDVRNPWEIIKTETPYDNNWLTIYHHEVLNPNHNPGIYGEVHFKNFAIGILPLDHQMNTYIVGQYRFPLKKYTWEMPEGGGKRDVDPLVSAKRELLEEVGLVAGKWQLIQELELSNSATDEIAYIYLAQDLQQDIPRPEDTEVLEIRKIPFAEMVKMVEKGEIKDAMTVAAVFKVQWMIQQNLIQCQ
jgi:8-oxo-dGTP pyrophosphatase MutT (NUDIX family)